MMTHFKYIYKSIALAACSLLLVACDDKLDEVPDNRTEIDTPAKVASLLTSAYPDATPAVICELSGDNYVDNNVVVPATHNDVYTNFNEEAYQWRDIRNYQLNDNDAPYSVWQAYYNGIATVNHAIEAMEKLCPGIGDLSTEEVAVRYPEVSASWGEAHVLRAYLHFVLVNVFAEAYKTPEASRNDWGIPYVRVTEHVVHVDYSTDEFRHNVTETYDLVEEDLLRGLPLINDANYKVPAYHFNKNAANAFAARFYLFKRDYEKCVNYATIALGANPSAALRKWNTINQNTILSRQLDYNDATLPCNFLIQSTYSLQDRMLGACRYAVNTGADITVQGRKWQVPSTIDILYTGGGPNWSDMLPAYEGNIMVWGAGQQYGIWLFRLYEFFEYIDKIAGIGYIHILYQPFTAEETLLCRAEAQLYLGHQQVAIRDLEYWTTGKGVSTPLTLADITSKYSRARHNIYCDDMHPMEMGFERVLDGSSDQAVLDCILHFRRIETQFEGMRWFDIKRYGTTVYHYYRGANEDEIHVDSLTWNDPRRVLQLPQNVMDAGYPGSRPTSGSLSGGGTPGYQVSVSKRDDAPAVSPYIPQ